MFAVIARWTVPAEHRATVLEALARMIAMVEANEPDCLVYHANASIDHPDAIVLYERYVDRAAFDLHCETDYFKTIVLGQIVPLLAHREREFLTAVA